jgi:methylmalonyl-CoA/ethylmalonyl-CoA epimerase
MKLNNGIMELTNLSHVGIAVKDAEKTAQFISSVWNIGMPEDNFYEPKPEEMIFGNPFKVRLVFIKFGTHTIELLQPLDNKSIWSKFIEEKGEGIHHIAYGVSNYDQMVSMMQKQKHPLLVAASFQGCRWCYFATSPGGFVIEFREEYTKK